MSRYISRPHSFWVEDETYSEVPLIGNIEVREQEPQDTGLLDSEGNPIWRLNDPIGFRIND